MKVSTRLRYGLRLLIDLAQHQESPHPIKLKEVSERQNISLNYLRQLIMPLETGGFIRSIRGNKGGYLLEKSPTEITVRDIASVLEGSMALVDCVDNPKKCRKSNTCPTRNLWMDVSEKIRSSLDKTTLFDLMQEGGPSS